MRLEALLRASERQAKRTRMPRSIRTDVKSFAEIILG